MQGIGIKELRDKLSHILERVEKGEVIRVLRHGKHIADIRPVRRSAEQTMLDRLRNRQLLGGGAGKIPPVKTVENLRPDLPVSDLVIEERR